MMLQPTQLQRLQAAVKEAEDCFKTFDRLNMIPKILKMEECSFRDWNTGNEFLEKQDLKKVLLLGTDALKKQLEQRFKELEDEFFSKTSAPDDPYDGVEEEGDLTEEEVESETAELKKAVEDMDKLMTAQASTDHGWEAIINSIRTEVWPRLKEEITTWMGPFEKA